VGDCGSLATKIVFKSLEFDINSTTPSGQIRIVITLLIIKGKTIYAMDDWGEPSQRSGIMKREANRRNFVSLKTFY
jgi:hypothetical protein